MNLLEGLESYLTSGVSRIIKEYKKKKLEDEHNILRNSASAISKIGKILTRLLNDDVFPNQKSEVRNYVSSEGSLEDDVGSEASSNSDESSDSSAEEYSMMNNSSQLSVIETPNDRVSDSEDHSEKMKESDKRGIKRPRLLVSEDESSLIESQEERPNKKRRGIANQDTAALPFGPLTVDDVLPKEDTDWDRSPEKKQKVSRRVPIWIVPLVVHYLTLPEFNNSIHPLWILRKCDNLRSQFNGYNYNKDKTDIGFQFAEYCIRKRQQELVSLQEQTTELKRVLHNPQKN